MESQGFAIAGLLPLFVSGFIFNLAFYPTRFFCSRAEGQRLLFLSAGSGLLMGIVAFGIYPLLIPWLVGWLPHAGQVGQWFHQAYPGVFSGPLVLAIVASPVFALAGNLALLIWTSCSGTRRKGIALRKVTFRWYIERFGSPMGQLLHRAVRDDKLLIVTLKSRKVYCGRVFEIPYAPDMESSQIELLPLFSGHRNKDNLQLVREGTDYPALSIWEAKRHLASLKKILQNLEGKKDQPTIESQNAINTAINNVRTRMQSAEEKLLAVGSGPDLVITDWFKILPLKEIETASIFDEAAYHAWFTTRAKGTRDTQSDEWQVI